MRTSSRTGFLIITNYFLFVNSVLFCTKMLQLSRIRKNVAIGQKRARETKLDLKSSVRKCSRQCSKIWLGRPRSPKFLRSRFRSSSGIQNQEDPCTKSLFGVQFIQIKHNFNLIFTSIFSDLVGIFRRLTTELFKVFMHNRRLLAI